MAGEAEMHLLDPETEGVRARAFSITDDAGRASCSPRYSVVRNK